MTKKDKILDAMAYIIYQVFANHEEDKWDDYDAERLYDFFALQEEVGLVGIRRNDEEIMLKEFKSIFTSAWRKEYDDCKDVVPSDMEYIYLKERWFFITRTGKLW